MRDSRRAGRRVPSVADAGGYAIGAPGREEGAGAKEGREGKGGCDGSREDGRGELERRGKKGESQNLSKTSMVEKRKGLDGQERLD